MKAIKMLMVTVAAVCTLSVGTTHAATTKAGPPDQHGKGFFFWWAKSK